MQDRRTENRKGYNARVELKSQTGYLLNVSQNGARLLLREPLRSGKPVTFLVERGGKTLALAGTPVWSRSEGCHHTTGLRFQSDQSELHHLGLPR